MLPLGVVALRAPACCERRLGLGRVTALAPMLLAETQAAPRTLRKRADRWSRAPPAQSLLQAPCAASLAARRYTGTVRTADLATTLPPPRRVGQGDRGRHEGSQAEHRGHQHADEAREADEGCAPRPPTDALLPRTHGVAASAKCKRGSLWRMLGLQQPRGVVAPDP